MDILCDKPSLLKEALNDEVEVKYSPALDIYTPDNAILQTLKGLYISSKLDFEDKGLIQYIKENAKPAVNKAPICITCRNFDEFDAFCREYLDNEPDLKVAYDVETTAAPYLSDRYALAGFSLANSVDVGCYVILDSIDYENPDKQACLNRLADVIKNHNMLVFNSQHEYIATKICLDVDLKKESKHLDDAYAMSLVMKTESFKADVFKLKLLCSRLLGTDNWEAIIDGYIDLATEIASDGNYDFDNLTDAQEDKLSVFYDMLSQYNYTKEDVKDFVIKLQTSYSTWKEQSIIPYSLIPSNMIMLYGCYDSCYLVKLFEFFEGWVKDLEVKLQDSLNKPNIMLAYEDCVNSQIMSAILTLNGIFISDERDSEVELKNNTESVKYYNKLWEVKSDVSGETLLREYVKNEPKLVDILKKNYILPKYLLDLIPDGFEFISTTPTLYSFVVRKKTDDLDGWIAENGLKPIKASTPDEYKIQQKHLKPYSALDDWDAVLESVLDDYFNDEIEKNGSLSVNVFKPMSSPDSLLKLLTRDLNNAEFLSRVVLYEYDNLPEKNKNKTVVQYLNENPIFNFDENNNLRIIAKKIKADVLGVLSKQYSYKQIYNDLVKEGIKSFASPIIAYIYNVFTATGCSVDNPKHSAFDFICRLKICRKYLRINSTFIYGNSGGYGCQQFVLNDSISESHLRLVPGYNSVLDTTSKTKALKEKPENSSRVVFGSWYANTAETGRWQATVHNVPAGSYCKRRFVSRYPGGVILINDMSQAEVRELAAISKCESLLETVKDPTVDIHKKTASLAFDVPYDEVTKDQRKQTKQGIFSIVYGREEQSLAQELFNGDKAAAKRLMDAIFKVYPEIPEYLQDALFDAKKHGYLVTRRGCPIFVNPYTASSEKEKGEDAWRRNVQNYAIQGGASMGMCTGTLVNIQKLIDKNNLQDKIKIICYIHDSVELDVHPSVLDKAYQIINYAFNELATKRYDVPTASDTAIGVSMGEELDFVRIEKNHYTIKGNLEDIEDLIKQLELTYQVDIINKEIKEKEYNNSVDWLFTPRSQLMYSDYTQNAEFEIKLN